MTLRVGKQVRCAHGSFVAECLSVYVCMYNDDDDDYDDNDRGGEFTWNACSTSCRSGSHGSLWRCHVSSSADKFTAATAAIQMVRQS
jgi:hypothetical protein